MFRTLSRYTLCALLLAGLPASAESPPSEMDLSHLGLPSASSVVVIPTASNSPGHNGAYFKTRVVIHNMTDWEYEIRAILCGPNGYVDDKAISMPANGFHSWDNFLKDIFGYEGNGAVVLASETDFLNGGGIAGGDIAVAISASQFAVTAEVYTDSRNGRYTTSVVNGVPPEIDEGDRAFNAGISVSQSQRVNLGVFNFGRSRSKVTAVVDDGMGTLLETIEFNVEPLTWAQKPVTVPVENGMIQWKMAGGTPYLWTVLVNNRSNDGTLVWPVRPGYWWGILE